MVIAILIFLTSGMKICGGQAEDGSYTGIFVKKIMLGGAVASDGMDSNTCFYGKLRIWPSSESVLQLS